MLRLAKGKGVIMSKIILPIKDLTKPTKQRKKKRAQIRKVSFKNQNKEQQAKRIWFSLNPPDADGQWDCYLGISPVCLIKVDEYTIIQEHLKPKGRYPELKYDPANRKPSCEFCNRLKSGIHIEKIIELYPNSKIALDISNQA